MRGIINETFRAEAARPDRGRRGDRRALRGARFRRALRRVMALADQINQYVDKTPAVELAKQEGQDAKLHEVCSLLINAFRLLTIYLKPVLPKLAQRAEEFLNVAPLHWADAGHLLPPAHLINAYEHLMQRIDPKQIDALVAANRESLEPAAVHADSVKGVRRQPSPQRKAQHQQATEDKLQGQAEPKAQHISIDDFAKVDLRIARIADASTSRAPTS
jgi:methionyl-tRNA synthetase